jgi:hypothetical protein
MEIAPIAGIRNLPVIKAPPADMGLSAVFDIENFARIGNETYTPSGAKSAGGREDEFDDPADDEEPERRVRVLEDGPARQISFFA